jgi:hypothetical protein
MEKKHQNISGAGLANTFLILVSVLALREGYLGHVNWYWVLLVTVPLVISACFTDKTGKEIFKKRSPDLEQFIDAK